jgi:hypothetical protein
VDSAGTLYIADTTNQRVRKVTEAGVITTVAGNGTGGYSGDNGLATAAKLNYPYGVAVDSAGTLYIADRGNDRVRKVRDGVITTVAGTGTPGYSGDNGLATAAKLNEPWGVVVDSTGTLYIADTNNHRVRKVTGNGRITTVAGTGTGGYGGDNGPATDAQLNQPYGVGVDSTGTLYIADRGNHRVRKVTGTVITTVAGTGTPGYSGDHGPATDAHLNSPFGVGVDSTGTLYIADTGNDRVRKVVDGVITTVAGNGTGGYNGDNRPATDAHLNSPRGVGVDSAGTLYITDTHNHRVRKVTGTG